MAATLRSRPKLLISGLQIDVQSLWNRQDQDYAPALQSDGMVERNGQTLEPELATLTTTIGGGPEHLQSWGSSVAAEPKAQEGAVPLHRTMCMRGHPLVLARCCLQILEVVHQTGFPVRGMKPALSIMHGKAHNWTCQVMFNMDMQGSYMI